MTEKTPQSEEEGEGEVAAVADSEGETSSSASDSSPEQSEEETPRAVGSVGELFVEVSSSSALLPGFEENRRIHGVYEAVRGILLQFQENLHNFPKCPEVVLMAEAIKEGQLALGTSSPSLRRPAVEDVTNTLLLLAGLSLNVRLFITLFLRVKEKADMCRTRARVVRKSYQTSKTKSPSSSSAKAEENQPLVPLSLGSRSSKSLKRKDSPVSPLSFRALAFQADGTERLIRLPLSAADSSELILSALSVHYFFADDESSEKTLLVIHESPDKNLAVVSVRGAETGQRNLPASIASRQVENRQGTLVVSEMECYGRCVLLEKIGTRYGSYNRTQAANLLRSNAAVVGPFLRCQRIPWGIVEETDKAPPAAAAGDADK